MATTREKVGVDQLDRSGFHATGCEYEPTAVSVLVPTWRRPTDLKRCINALLAQTLQPDEVVVCIRASDRESWTCLEAVQAIRSPGPTRVVGVNVGEVNLTESMNRGLARTTGNIVALTDDDAAPRANWIERLVDTFVRPDVVAVGGLDMQPHERGEKAVVGKLNWYGRCVGNHHLGTGPARTVDLLKGVNMAVRGDLLRGIGFDRRLRGKGNVSHWEMALCFELRKHGTLVYDPAIVVDHHVALRVDGDTNARGGFDRDSFIDGVHNEVVATMTGLGAAGRLVYRPWLALVGTRATPGFAQWLRTVVKRPGSAAVEWSRFIAARQGSRIASTTLAGDCPKETRSDAIAG